MASSKVVSGVFLAADELFRVEKLAVCPSPDLIDDSGLQIQEHGTRDVFPSPGLTEKGVEGIISASNCFVTRHLSIRLNKLEKEQQ